MRCPEDLPQGHQLPADSIFMGGSEKPPRLGHESLWQREGGFSSHWRGQDGNHPTGTLDMMCSWSAQPETRCLGSINPVPR